MADRIGSDYGAASVAGISSDRGDALISADTTGSTALLFGPAAYRVMVAGVSNGDIAMPPDDALAVLSDDNPLPFFTWNNSGGTGITAQVVANGTASSGNALRISIGTAVASGTATLVRIEPITGTGDRGFTFVPQMTAIGTLNGGTAALADLSFSWLGPDQSTAVGTAPSTQTQPFANFYTINTLSAGLDTDGAASIYNCAPVGASFLKMTATFRVTAAGGTATRTLDITDFAIAVGESQVYISEKTDVNEYGAALIDQISGSVGIVSGAGTAVGAAIGAVYIGNGDASFGDPTYSYILADATGGIIDLFASSVDVAGDLTTTGNATIGGALFVGSITDSSGDLNLAASGGDVIVQDSTASLPRLLYRDSAGTFLGGIQMQGANIFRFFNGSTTNDYGYIYAERIYPMNGTSASRFMSDNGTRTELSGGLETAGSIVTVGSILNDSISTTTATANAAIWVLSSGTSYTLRRNSSSKRYKTNIVDADAAVLEAARRIKPRHYESTIADESGATRLGFIAEEVEAAGLTHAVGYDAEGRPESLDTTALIAALFVRVNDLEARLAALEAK